LLHRCVAVLGRLSSCRSVTKREREGERETLCSTPGFGCACVVWSGLRGLTRPGFIRCCHAFDCHKMPSHTPAARIAYHSKQKSEAAQSKPGTKKSNNNKGKNKGRGKPPPRRVYNSDTEDEEGNVKVTPPVGAGKREVEQMPLKRKREEAQEEREERKRKRERETLTAGLLHCNTGNEHLRNSTTYTRRCKISSILLTSFIGRVKRICRYHYQISDR
jgi:hypothetical protein